MENLTTIGFIAASCLVGIVVGWFINIAAGQRSLKRAQAEAEEITSQARQEASRRKKQARLGAREELRRAHRRADRETREKKAKLAKQQSAATRLEREIEEQKAGLQKQSEDLTSKETDLASRQADLDGESARLTQLIEEETVLLEEVSGLGRDAARELLLDGVRKSSKLEMARLQKEAREEALRLAEAETQKIMALAIERTASDFSTNRTVSSVTLEDDKSKGRLIGHEGKNIKAFEAATGMQLVVDDTPNQVTVSGFHPIRREVARLSLHKLIKEGNIHPRRIDDTVRKMRRKTNNVMRRAAEDALKELRIKRVHPEMINTLGRLHFRTSYGQNVLRHSKEVGYLTGIMAAELGLDETIARRAGLLHDIGKAIDYEREGTHPEIGEEVARRYDEHPIVVNAIASHHEDCEPISPISILVAAADALSGARPGARRKSLADYIRRVEKLEEIAKSHEGVSESYAIQAGRELRVIAQYDSISDEQSAFLAADIAQQIEAEVDYPGKIKVTVIREVWATEVAR